MTDTVFSAYSITILYRYIVFSAYSVVSLHIIARSVFHRYELWMGEMGTYTYTLEGEGQSIEKRVSGGVGLLTRNYRPAGGPNLFYGRVPPSLY